MPTAKMKIKAGSPASDLVTEVLGESILGAWRTNARVTTKFIEDLPAPLWDAAVPGAPRRTVRTILGHLNNSRSRWLRTLGLEHGIPVPALVDLRKVTRRGLVSALRRSGEGIEALLRLGLQAGGRVPPSRAYVWRNLPLDVGHVLTYFVAHEAHHRGQILMLARPVGRRVPKALADDLWQWTARVREGRPSGR